jgi:hypothetical protein
MILLYIFSVSYFRQTLILYGLFNSMMLFSYIMLTFLILSRVLTYQLKSVLISEEPLSWSYYKGNRKISFELSEILSIKKSYWGLYSSFVIKIKDAKQIIYKIRIPAEKPRLTDFITNLSGHLSKEQISQFLKFHRESLAVNFEIEKSSKFLRIFCFFIPAIAFFIAMSVWENFIMMLSILWVILSLILPLIWTAINLLLLKIAAHNFSVFSKILSIWVFLGVILYMVIGIAFQKVYLQ